MPDIFVSYSRRDKEFVSRLVASLRDRDRAVWVDVEGIDDAEEFPAAIRSAIEKSDSFVFVITPDSAASQYCSQEVDYARALRKRIVPILRTTVADDALPPDIRDRNWIPFTEDADFASSLERLLAACDRDLDHARKHTRWLVKALEWESEARDRSFLLRGSELRAAEEWLTRVVAGTEPQPTALQREFVLQSRRATSRRGRLAFIGAVTVTVLALLLGAFSFVSRSQAIRQRTTALARADAQGADAALDTDPVVSLVLGQRAVRGRVLPQTLSALQAALDRSSLLGVVQEPGGCDAGDRGWQNASDFDPAGPRLATVTCDGAVAIRDSETLAVKIRRTRVIRHPSGDLHYSPDGRTIAVGENGGIRLLDARTLAEIRWLPLSGLDYSKFSPDGRWLLVSRVRGTSFAYPSLWRVPVDGSRPTALVPQARELDAVVLSGGKQIALTTIPDEALEIRDAVTGRLLHRVSTGGSLGAVTYSPVGIPADGKVLAAGITTPDGDAEIQLWNTRTWTRSRILPASQQQPVTLLRFSPGSDLLATAYQNYLTDIWQVATGSIVGTVGASSAEVDGLSFDRTGARLATTIRGGSVRIWRSHGPELFDAAARFANKNTVAGIADDGRVITAIGPTGGTDGEVERWQASDGRNLSSTPLPRGTFHASYTDGSSNDSPTLSPDGKEVLVVSEREGKPVLQVFMTATMTLVATLPYVPYGYAAFSSDDRQVLLYYATLADGSISRQAPTLLDIPSGRRHSLASPQAGGAIVTYSPDDKEVLGDTLSGHLLVWRASDGSLLQDIVTPEANFFPYVDPADPSIAMLVDSTDITLFDLDRKKVIRRLDEPAVGTAAFTRDGRYIVTESTEAPTLHVWDVNTGRLLRQFSLPQSNSLMAMDESGSDVVSVDHTGVIRGFDVCATCQNAPALLRLAAARGTPQLTAQEVDAVNSP